MGALVWSAYDKDQSILESIFGPTVSDVEGGATLRMNFYIPRHNVMGPTKVLMYHPCPLGLSVILTRAHILYGCFY